MPPAPDEGGDESAGRPGADGSDPGTDRDERLSTLHAHLEATAERPVERDAARWLGEAEAVAADVADGDAPERAVETRLEQVRDLLAHVDTTGDDEADRHLQAARDLLDRLQDCS